VEKYLLGVNIPRRISGRSKNISLNADTHTLCDEHCSLSLKRDISPATEMKRNQIMLSKGAASLPIAFLSIPFAVNMVFPPEEKQ